MRPSLIETELSLPESLSELSVSEDVLLICAGLTASALVQLISSSQPLQAAFGLPLVLFFPGYALLLVLFPRRPDPSGDGGIPTGSLGPHERLALSFGLSLTVAPLVALSYAVFDIPLTRLSVVSGFTVFTVVFLVCGEARRRQLPQSERFRFPPDRWLGTVRSRIRHPRYGTDELLNLALALAVLFALSSLGYGLLVPNVTEQYTDLYLTTQNDDGEFVTGGYPVNRTGGEVVVSINNHEGETVEYHLVTQLQHVSLPQEGEGPVRVRERRQLRRDTYRIAHNETGRDVFSVVPVADSGDEAVRLVYLLYRDDVPAEPSMDDAYRSVYLWLETETNTAGQPQPQSQRGSPVPPTRRSAGAVPSGGS